MKTKKFVEEVFEIAFGDNAINREFKKKEVLERLRYFSDRSYEADELSEERDDVEIIGSSEELS